MKKQIKRSAPPLPLTWACLPVLLLLFMAFLWSNCTKDPAPDTPLTEEDKLPPATQEGNNTFGCLVNGQAYIPKGSGFLDPAISTIYSEITGLLVITTQKVLNETPVRLELGFAVTANLGGEYNIEEGSPVMSDTSLICASPNWGFTDNVGLIDYVSTNKSVVHITKLDKNAGVISGTFEFDIYSIDCGDSLRITKGRFDVKYK